MDACHSGGVCKFLGIESNWEHAQTDLKKIQAFNNMHTLIDQGSMPFGKYMALYGHADQQPDVIFMERCSLEIGNTFS